MEDNPIQSQPKALRNCARCQAKARSGQSCRSPAVRGKRVCRMHGGARGSGAPMGEANGMFRHGAWTAPAVALRRDAAALLRVMKKGNQG